MTFKPVCITGRMGFALVVLSVLLSLVFYLGRIDAPGVRAASRPASDSVTIMATCDGSSGTMVSYAFPAFLNGALSGYCSSSNQVETSLDRAQRTFVSFNTASIPPGATITAASISLFVGGKFQNDDGTSLEIVSASQGAYLAGDAWSRVGSTSFASRRLSELPRGATTSFNLGPEGVAAIRKGGVTQYALRLGLDMRSIMPTGTNVVTTVLEQGYSGVQLQVTYEPPPPTPTPVPAPGATVSYARGWNIVAGPEGTTFPQANPILYTSQTSGFTTVPNTQEVKPGWGYWANFSSDATVTMNGAGSSVYATTLEAGQYKLVGNPSGTKTATVIADVIYVYDPASGFARYQGSAALGVGQGAWAYSAQGGPVTVAVIEVPTPTPTVTATATPSPTSPPTSTPPPTPTATSTAVPTPTPLIFSYAGTTNQGKAVSFEVKSDFSAITGFRIALTADCRLPSSDSSEEFLAPEGKSIVNGRFEFSKPFGAHFDTYVGQFDPKSSTFQGTWRKWMSLPGNFGTINYCSTDGTWSASPATVALPPTPTATPIPGVSRLVGRYLMAFDACNGATADCSNPQNHQTYLAQSADGASWSPVPGYIPYQGSAPDLIRRGNTLYIYTPGTVRRYRIDTDVWEDPVKVTVKQSDGTDELFAGPSPILNSDGRIVLFYLVGQLDGDPASCIPGQASCVKRFRSATEVPGSDGTAFVVDPGSRVEINLTFSGSASDPDIFAGSSGFILCISRGNSVEALYSSDLRGTFSDIPGLPLGGTLSSGSGNVPAGHFDAASGQYWIYVQQRVGNVSVIRRAAPRNVNTQVPDSSFLTVIAGATFPGLDSTYTVESPGFALNSVQ